MSTAPLRADVERALETGHARVCVDFSESEGKQIEKIGEHAPLIATAGGAPIGDAMNGREESVRQ